MQRPTGSGESNRRKDPVKRGQTIFANVRNRHRVQAAGAILGLLMALATIGVAKADTPAGYVQVGHNSDTFRNPNNPAQYVTWAVAVDLGSTDADDDVKEVFSGVGRVTHGAGVIRSQVVNVRSGIGARVINDYFPSKNPEDPVGPVKGRNNTPGAPPYNPAAAGSCTSGSGSTLNLFDDQTPGAGNCSPKPADLIKNPLNSAADYSPDASLVRGFSDQLPTDQQNCPTVAARAFFEVRFADGTVHAFNARSDSGVSSDGPGCP